MSGRSEIHLRFAIRRLDFFNGVGIESIGFKNQEIHIRSFRGIHALTAPEQFKQHFQASALSDYSIGFVSQRIADFKVF